MEDSSTTIFQLRRKGKPGSCPKVLDLMRLSIGVTKFGRSLHNDYFLNSDCLKAFISRHHADIRGVIIDTNEVEYVLNDHGLNGTYVNDVRVNKSCILHEGDIVTFGHKNGANIIPGQCAPQVDSEFSFIFERVPSSFHKTHSSSPDRHESLMKDQKIDGSNLLVRTVNGLLKPSMWEEISNWSDLDADKSNSLPSILSENPSTKSGEHIGSDSGIEDAVNKPFQDIEEINEEHDSLIETKLFCQNSSIDREKTPEQNRQHQNRAKPNNSKLKNNSKNTSTVKADKNVCASKLSNNIGQSSLFHNTADMNNRAKETYEFTEESDEFGPNSKHLIRSMKSRREDTISAVTGASISVHRRPETPPGSHMPCRDARKIVFPNRQEKTSKSNAGSKKAISSRSKSLSDNTDESDGDLLSRALEAVRNFDAGMNSEDDILAEERPLKFELATVAVTKKNQKQKRKKVIVAKPKKKRKGENVEYDSNGLMYYDVDDCSASDCCKPMDSKVDWVQCDDCDLWYHTACVGCSYSQVKTTSSEFHCGCI